MRTHTHTYHTYIQTCIPHMHTHMHTQVSYTGIVEERSRGSTLIQFTDSGSKDTGSFTTATISPLTPATRYRFRVAAETARGQGEDVINYGETDDPFGGIPKLNKVH